MEFDLALLKDHENLETAYGNLASIGYTQIKQLSHGEEPNIQWTWDFLCTHQDAIV